MVIISLRIPMTGGSRPHASPAPVPQAELEVAEEQRNYYAPYGGTQEGMSRLPFVRVFSLDTKGYVYADVDDVQTYEFDSYAMSKLHLPKEMIGVLSRVFMTPVEGLFGILKGKSRRRKPIGIDEMNPASMDEP